MSETTIEIIPAARRAAFRSHQLGKMIRTPSRLLLSSLTSFLPMALFIGYRTNQNKTGTDWSAVWSSWAIVVSGWLTLMLGVMLVALTGVIAQSKAASLQLQLALIKS
jgi:hypothetical protein